MCFKACFEKWLKGCYWIDPTWKTSDLEKTEAAVCRLCSIQELRSSFGTSCFPSGTRLPTLWSKGKRMLSLPPAEPWCPAPSAPPWWGCSRSPATEGWGAGTSDPSSGSPGSWFWGKEAPWCHGDRVCSRDRASPSLCLMEDDRPLETNQNS